MPRIGKSIETESRLMAAGGGGREGGEERLLMVQGFFCG